MHWKAAIEIPAREKATLHQRGEVTNPALWDIDSPNLYTLETVVTVGEEVVECQTEPLRLPYHPL